MNGKWEVHSSTPKKTEESLRALKWLRRLLASVAASLVLTVSVAVIRYFAAFPVGVKFDGPLEFFAFIGFLALLLPVGAAAFFILFSFIANRKTVARREKE